MLRAYGYMLLAVSAFAAPSYLPAQAQQIRLAFTNDPTAILVHWATSNSTPAGYSPLVQWGTTTSFGSSSAGITSNYVAFKIKSPQLYFATMSGLLPNTLYNYRVGDANLGWSFTLQFVSPPAAGEARYPVNFAAFGDMGTTMSQDTLALLLTYTSTHEYDFVVHAGDIAYADDYVIPYNGINQPEQYDGVLSLMYNMISPSAARVPWMFCTGNHEMMKNGTNCAVTPDNCYIEDYLAWLERVAPSMPQASGNPFYYSWNFGPVHFLSVYISPDNDFDTNSSQYAWIVADLLAVDRTATPWVIVYNHYSSKCSNCNWCHEDESQCHYDPPKPPTAIGAIWDTYAGLFLAADTRVDVYIGAHVHASEVLYPLNADGSIAQTHFTDSLWTLNVLAGSAGSMEVHGQSWISPAPDYSYWRANDDDSQGGYFGYFHFEIVNNTHIHLKFWDATHNAVPKDMYWSRPTPALQK